MKKTVPVLIWRAVFGLLASAMINVGHAALSAPVGSKIIKKPTSGAPQDDVGNASTGNSSPNTQPNIPTRPPSGSSGLSAGLPPPPKDLPSPPLKDDKTLEPNELVVVTGTMADAQALAQQAQALGLGVKRRTHLGGLGFVVTVFRVPKEMSVGNALTSLRQVSPNVWADANHRYQLFSDAARTYGQRLVGWNGSPGCGRGVRIGMVDTAIDTAHAMLTGRAIEARSFLASGIPVAGADHGTATAALLVGRQVGLLPGAKLYVANVFRARGSESDTTAEWVVLALNWLAEQRVTIMNLSFGGPRNLLVEVAVRRLLERGIAVVAAAGNGGEGAPPVFPAAQPGVVAVTAVDAELRPYRRANRGDYIAFSAPGVDVWTAAPGRDGMFVSGTSYATPFVIAALAVRANNVKQSWAPVVSELQTKARDLGDKGKDPVFGWGLIQAVAACGSGTTDIRAGGTK
jgi:hypothetical protein